MSRGPHQSDDYIDAHFGNEDHADAWTPGPHNRPLPTEGPLADALRRYRATWEKP